MASDSISPNQKRFKYEVFLSFSREDMNFVDNLYDALKKSSINAYKGYERVEKRAKISDELIRSIKDSRFHIIVFSKNYASSSWCLDELVKIMECHKTIEQSVYPVFYDVEPTDVSNQSGAFGEAFAIHEKKGAAGKWRDALIKAAGLAGWELKTAFDGPEGAIFIQKVVKHFFLEPYFINRSLDGSLVGMDTRVKNLVLSLETDDVRMIGIKGIGGGGKTALAKAVFNYISIRFEGKSFVENVREVSRGYGLLKLQKQVLQDVLNVQSIDVESVDDGIIMLKKVMRSRKVLVVLDDVDNIYQLKVLVDNPTWFNHGSRIIVTTRDEHVLKAYRVNSIHDVSLLSNEEAICLFSRCAFKRETPIQGYEELSGKIVNYAAGLPSTIKGLGSFLRGKTELEWHDTLKRLQTIPFWETMANLKHSYDGLEQNFKEIFLDVACILRGEKKDVAIKILESCGLHARIGFIYLEEKSLITISDDDRLLLHDLTEEMGKNIVRRMYPYKPRKHSRLWIKEEIEDILVNELGTEATRSIKLHNTDLHADIIMKGLRKMKFLKYLCVEGYSSSWKAYDVSPHLPDTLRCLHWHKYPFRCLPETFLADYLVKIEMVGSNISQLWEGGGKKIFKKLVFLNLSGSKLCNLDLRTTPYLKELYLRECSDFEDLHVSAECPYLQLLVLGCPKLTNLNLELIPNLEELCLEECHEFLELHMPLKPPKLTLSNKEITHLPNSICMLKHQKFLELKSCLHLEQLPHDLDRLECLEELYLTDCISLHDIPSSICKMKCLKYLHLPYCIMVKELPEELGSLECLKELNIEGAGVRHLPQSIVQLKGLHVIGSRGRLESYGFTSLKEISSYTASCYI